MNTSITSSNATADSLTTLANTYSEIDITEVSKITGSIDSVNDIFNSSKFVGSHTSDLVITETMTNEQLALFNASTSGIVEQST
tara:strand:- start:66 stop:317 length:252 start_codon:yes stop_codon:yes gene_type:complete